MTKYSYWIVTENEHSGCCVWQREVSRDDASRILRSTSGTHNNPQGYLGRFPGWWWKFSVVPGVYLQVTRGNP